MIIHPNLYTHKADAWKHLIQAWRRRTNIEGDTWSGYRPGKGRHGIRLTSDEQSDSAGIGLENDRLDKFCSPNIQLFQPCLGPTLTVINTDMPKLVVDTMQSEAASGGDLSVAPPTRDQFELRTIFRASNPCS